MTVLINYLLKQMKCCLSCLYMSIVIFGDFNDPSIDWTTWNSTGMNSEQSAKGECIETISVFLFQQFLKDTQAREKQRPSLLDLIFTNEDGIVSDVDFWDPLGKSDHGILMFNLYFYTENQKITLKMRYDDKWDCEQL